jgi:hypothetical protein
MHETVHLKLIRQNKKLRRLLNVNYNRHRSYSKKRSSSRSVHSERKRRTVVGRDARKSALRLMHATLSNSTTKRRKTEREL